VRPGGKGVDVIRMYHREMGHEVVDWIQLTQDEVQ